MNFKEDLLSQIPALRMLVNFIVRLPVHEAALEAQKPELRQELRPESRQESDLAFKILTALKVQVLSRRKLSRGLGHKSISGELNKQIITLLESGLIAYTIPESPNSRLQEYCITEAGLQLLKKMSRMEDFSFGNVGSRQESELAFSILQILKNKVINKAELAKNLGHKSISGELNKQIINLLKNQYIEYTIPEKPSSRLRKYRITETGLKTLNNNEN